MKTLTLFLLFATALHEWGSNCTGLWVTVDDETKEHKSVVCVYGHANKYYGRIVHLFKNKEAKAKLPGKPGILGLDIIWDMEKDGENLNGGKILDPKKGKIYACEMWRKGENLIVRGKIAFLGRNQTWLPYKGDVTFPDAKQMIPRVPATK